MKTIRSMRALALGALAMSMGLAAHAQVPSVNNPNNPNVQNGRDKMKKPDASPGASVSEVIGINNLVTINYHRPAEKGRKLWTGDSTEPNTVVFHNESPKPWRAGANENTTICFQDAVKIEGKDLAAGTYGLFIIPTGGDWTIVFSKKSNVWGLTYDKADDALRVTVKPQDATDTEWLQYTFEDPSANGATATMHWGTKKVGFKVESATPVAAAPARPEGMAGMNMGGAKGADKSADKAPAKDAAK